MELDESNELISLFMGNRLINGIYPYHAHNFPSPVSCTRFGLKYHKSWNWLMPVIKRIRDISLTEEYKKADTEWGEHNIVNQHDIWRDKIMDVILFVEIKDCYDVCLEFIEWYNENNLS